MMNFIKLWSSPSIKDRNKRSVNMETKKSD